MKITLLDENEINLISQRLPDWEKKGNKLIKEFKFSNFIEAFGFMTKVAIIAEGLNHHPNWENVYNSVKIELWTHSLNGLSNLDIQLAISIDNLIDK